MAARVANFIKVKPIGMLCAATVEAVQIPVIVNGDVVNGENGGGGWRRPTLPEL